MRLVISLLLYELLTATTAQKTGYWYQNTQPQMFNPEIKIVASQQTDPHTVSQRTANIRPAQLDTEYRREYYSYSDPDEQNDDEMMLMRNLVNLAKKNLRVLFIRTPEHKNLERATVALAKQAAEQKTAIYVLTKQTDLSELVGKLNKLRSEQIKSKPEVHFIKYRTPEEANKAQQVIQAHYNELPGGSTNVRPPLESQAKVLDFVGNKKQNGNVKHATTNYQHYLPGIVSL